MTIIVVFLISLFTSVTSRAVRNATQTQIVQIIVRAIQSTGMGIVDQIVLALMLQDPVAMTFVVTHMNVKGLIFIVMEIRVGIAM